MNKTDLRKLALKKLNSREVQKYKKTLCGIYTDKKQQKECMSAFDKSFVKSFMDSYKKIKV
jgi:hypothetical protein